MLGRLTITRGPQVGSLLAVLAIPAVWMIHRARPQSPGKVVTTMARR